MWGTPSGGAPPGTPQPPQGSPGVTEFWKKLQKFPKIILKLDMHQNTPNYNSDIHFRPPGLLGGPWGAQNGFLASPGGYSEARAPIFFLSVLYWPIEQGWGGPEARFWFHLFIRTAYHKITQWIDLLTYLTDFNVCICELYNWSTQQSFSLI